MRLENELSVGELAKRAGVAVSTLHFYETKGLISPRRSSGNQRRYSRSLLRRVAIIRIAQRAGISLAEIKSALSALPAERTPNADDWRKLASSWNKSLEERIRALTQLRDEMAGCIGCGCLSLRECPLRNPRDELGQGATGAVLLQHED
ncbi:MULTISPECIES: redox-sensitive transcriptional activator SoxR [Rhizobium/Agrobacterium group]|uniref:redox-sensitive transcriptional activator SoxR n=1 Tax=Rhizobium/Agrobacterium group TaxID=227290 RepID=UPI001ADC66B7|nr:MULTISPECIES: redox-sensitive transcriptional activator SoxR [Rhizobium/Agrobacterium group]MBO9112726.1 redox-sensitive transcriptional activator SoxR [Agrobacterium sp. S2/73]QXZ76212.1 redox-sensitive transcriptional activator SoxR [Agrobacterium sp. S7/73]QYA17240.1 redox-sensitive transcriptional activator SoxR [Rhizobium sp. AB2/73]UEQ85187.1 redox-sensitive transcriptional activator SoxR [Rhizobium sp. AB2/73]